MQRIILLRLTQILLILPCLLREIVNFCTDIEQHSRLIEMTQKILSFPTKEKAQLLFDRSIHNTSIVQANYALLILTHLVVTFFLLWGTFTLIKHLKTNDFRAYNRMKTNCIIGLCLGIAQYVFIFGFFSMDYFLSWMQGINFNSDIVTYTLPFCIALLYLTLKDFQEIQE